MIAGVSARQLQEADWEKLRDMRLRALKADPGVFGSNFGKESQMTEADWRSWLTNPDTGIFGIYHKDTMIGMTGVALWREDPSGKSAILWGSWLEPEFRRRGVSRVMYEARLEWAKHHPTCERVVVSHRESNEASKHANQKNGFVFTHRTTKQWPDGATEDDLFYELVVKPGPAPGMRP